MAVLVGILVVVGLLLRYLKKSTTTVPTAKVSEQTTQCNSDDSQSVDVEISAVDDSESSYQETSITASLT